VLIGAALSYGCGTDPSRECSFAWLIAHEAIILRVEFQQVTNETGLCPLEILFDLEEVGDGERGQ
jgi:hypothetical protein